MRGTSERILLIGDTGREVESALAAAVPAVRVTSVASYFDAIAELSTPASSAQASGYTAVVASAEPIERRPEPAVRTLRQLAGGRKLVLFGHPTLEPLSRKMLEFGCDDYVVCPPSAQELQNVLGRPALRIAPAAPPLPAEKSLDEPPPTHDGPAPDRSSICLNTLEELDLAELFLDALAQHPNTAPAACVKQINSRIGPALTLAYSARGKPPPADRAAAVLLSHPVHSPAAAAAPTSTTTAGDVGTADDETGRLHLFLPQAEATEATLPAARHLLARLAGLVARIVGLQERHNALQKLAITDQLTGAYNRRYFEHFLQRILERARAMRFTVTLLLFDIDDFKRYNDENGHGLGDDILRETVSLMKRCCREHDLVARIGGDEFAVVFWEKEGPRQPKDTSPAARPPGTPAPAALTYGPRTPPNGPRQVFDRFRKLIGTRQFEALGPGGRGVLTISGGFADFPWDGRDMNELIATADGDLMFVAKKQKKAQQMLLVGQDQSAGEGGGNSFSPHD